MYPNPGTFLSGGKYLTTVPRIKKLRSKIHRRGICYIQRYFIAIHGVNKESERMVQWLSASIQGEFTSRSRKNKRILGSENCDFFSPWRRIPTLEPWIA